ncbi:MAG: transglutaminase domain-containing protein, partial [Candidatus Thermoplasmatota archaeon]|nr:transglutaminase domain-containing protein [Candidatus Thermoplasmatota archaeon]
YNAYHVAAAFHHVRNNIAYELELPGEDWWQSPQETIMLGKGDCEDHALLLASILKGLGGTVNINIIAGHAFASVYLGATEEEAMKNWDVMQEYYGYMPDEEYDARPQPCWIDGSGYWLALDTLGGLYAGGLPVNSAPIRGDHGHWAFTSTMIVSIIHA